MNLHLATNSQLSYGVPTNVYRNKGPINKLHL